MFGPQDFREMHCEKSTKKGHLRSGFGRDAHATLSTCLILVEVGKPVNLGGGSLLVHGMYDSEMPSLALVNLVCTLQWPSNKGSSSSATCKREG